MSQILKLTHENQQLKRQINQYQQVLGVSPYVDDSVIKGGYHVVKNISERDSIDCCHRKLGMKVLVIGNDLSFKEYILKTDDCKKNIWEEVEVIFEEVDPTVPDHVKSITNTDITNWNNKLSSEADTLESVVNRGNNTTQKITVDKLNVSNPYNATGDSTYTKNIVAKPNGDIGWEDKSTGAKRWSDASIINTKLVRDTTKWILNFDIVNIPSGLSAFEVKFYLVDRTAPKSGYLLPQYYNLIGKRNGTVLDGTNIYNKSTYVDNINFTVSTYQSGEIPSSIQTFFCDNIEFLFADNTIINASSPLTTGVLITIMLRASAGNSGQQQVQILQSYIN